MRFSIPSQVLRFGFLVSALFLLLLANIALANHGPGTSGGGNATVSGETLKPGQFELSLREDYTQFEQISRAGADRRALRAGGFDALDHSSITIASISAGIVQDFQLGANIGYYWGNNFIDAERAEELEYVREWFPALVELYRSAAACSHIVVCECL